MEHQCCRELPEGVEIKDEETGYMRTGDHADRCPREGAHYHVIEPHPDLRLVIHLCDEHSHEHEAAINGYTPAEFTEFLKVELRTIPRWPTCGPRSPKRSADTSVTRQSYILKVATRMLGGDPASDCTDEERAEAMRWLGVEYEPEPQEPIPALEVTTEFPPYAPAVILARCPACDTVRSVPGDSPDQLLAYCRQCLTIRKLTLGGTSRSVEKLLSETA